MTQNEHLEWLLFLMKDNPEAWELHCWHRAKELATQPGLEELPERLAAAMSQRSSPKEEVATANSPTTPK